MARERRDLPSGIPSEDPVEVAVGANGVLSLRLPFEDEDWYYRLSPDAQVAMERDYWKNQAARLAGKANRLQDRLRQAEAEKWRVQHADRVVTRVIRPAS